MLRLARTTRGLRLVRLLTSINRGMRGLGNTFERRGVGYVAMLTLIVIFAGAAGILAFEKESAIGIDDYGTAVWWSAMMVTSMGSESWPKASEGRALCFFLALYAFTMFGYLTATLSSFFVDQDRKRETKEKGIE